MIVKIFNNRWESQYRVLDGAYFLEIRDKSKNTKEACTDCNTEERRLKLGLKYRFKVSSYILVEFFVSFVFFIKNLSYLKHLLIQFQIYNWSLKEEGITWAQLLMFKFFFDAINLLFELVVIANEGLVPLETEGSKILVEVARSHFYLRFLFLFCFMWVICLLFRMIYSR